MATLDGWLESLMHGGAGIAVVLFVSLALGLRHASDPDHLAAVTTLIASDKDGEKVRKAGSMGLLWGLGHGTTLVLLGLPLVLLGRFLPEAVRQSAEFIIGGIIVFLAVRLLIRWRKGVFHAHSHAHGKEAHRHVHSHKRSGSHGHGHVSPLRTPLSSYAIGLVHGIGGSGGLTLLLLSTISSKVEATAALLVFAVGTAISMSLLSTLFGLALVGGPVGRNFQRVAPVLGCLSLAFGLWYALGATGLVTYPF